MPQTRTSNSFTEWVNVMFEPIQWTTFDDLEIPETSDTVRSNLPVVGAPRGRIRYAPLIPEPDDRYAEPTRNLAVGDRVRYTAVNGHSDAGIVTAVEAMMADEEIRNMPDWVPRGTRHQTYRIRPGGRSDVAAPRVCWFRIQRLETDE